MESERDAFIALNSLPLIGSNNFYSLLARFGSAAAAFDEEPATLATVDGIGPKTADQIARCKPQAVARREQKLAEREGVRIVTAIDERYPANLKASYNPPPVLYMIGDIEPQDIIALAIVGTRLPSPYGKITGENFSAALSRRGFTIVSGLARGIDTIAHTAALEAGGRTIAILGSGLDQCYPPENRELLKRIGRSGSVVSQFPFGTGPEKRNFPIRNRIISLLSLGVLVVEAGEKSGTLITAYGALEEGREVFAIPGRVDSQKSIGCHRLIQRGAKLVTSPDDIVVEFPPEVQRLTVPPERPIGAPLSSEAENILALLREEERHIDHLIQMLNIPSGVVSGILLELELKGLVRQLPGKVFAKLEPTG